MPLSHATQPALGGCGLKLAKPSSNPRKPRGNYVSEWFGHRVYPGVVATDYSISDQSTERCPFLSDAIGAMRECVKRPASRGVCTINSASNGIRQDWLVCPYRALNQHLIALAARRLFGTEPDRKLWVLPAIRLEDPDTRNEVTNALASGEPVFIYFDAKLGGELSLPQTDRSPELAFDVTIIELVRRDAGAAIGRVGLLEIQTMDFHGSYRLAVHNLREALRMHGADFGATLAENQRWLAEGVEGPNIANVFKRTFYQIMFKFQLGIDERCAGCVLAIPQAVWDSWQKHLGLPELTPIDKGTSMLLAPGVDIGQDVPGWILVFDTDPATGITPSPLEIKETIATNAAAIGYWALDAAPRAALQSIGADMGLFAAIERRIKPIWPALADTVSS